MAKKSSKKGKGSYAKYKAEAHLAKNKIKKAERHAKRLAKFAARKEAGKAYEYKPIAAAKGTREFYIESAARAEKAILSRSHRLPLARLTSEMRKLQNLLDSSKAKAKELAARKDVKNGKKGKATE